MAAKNGVDFGGSLERMAKNIRQHGERIIRSVLDFMGLLRDSLEQFARGNARWKDRTGDARRFLRATVERFGHLMNVTLTHGVWYGIYLELANAGKWGIILVALQAHAPLWRQWCWANGFR